MHCLNSGVAKGLGERGLHHDVGIRQKRPDIVGETRERDGPREIGEVGACPKFLLEPLISSEDCPAQGQTRVYASAARDRDRLERCGGSLARGKAAHNDDVERRAMRVR